MVENTRELGSVKLVQVQPSGLIIETPSGYFYDVSRRVEVKRLMITSLGIEATTPNGKHVLDIHHINHPDKAYDDDDLVSIGFTSHYEAMRERFGEHMVDGSAGENIIIEYADEVWVDDLGEQIAIESVETGQRALLDFVSFAPPCEEFSHFVAQSQHERLPAAELKSTLQFLNNGRRGFLLLLSEGQESATVQAGDKVFVVREKK
ncbi:MAG: MOSC domain-containing protein [Anaerolineales bacterium]|nr:MOSC domain-containing protein [Anaerolineales bacterium]